MPLFCAPMQIEVGMLASISAGSCRESKAEDSTDSPHPASGYTSTGGTLSAGGQASAATGGTGTGTAGAPARGHARSAPARKTVTKIANAARYAHHRG